MKVGPFDIPVGRVIPVIAAIAALLRSVVGDLFGNELALLDLSKGRYPQTFGQPGIT